ncbi:MAG: 1-(5-phosphoribosyl)-5-[(5-phosphoribosylamino)methylideneamino]imidazole-4-carboxamide isomerase [Ruminococcaceae bacterium]|nr:1-(5-phosphoribosyl)-5-[(5-phosphoribosylamino)methylideneamino]imidazole-4-carboxamide isomerase [Oscillospiraceae bacterium]
MLIFPAIDLFEGKAVRLLKGDYAQMTVYNEDPLAVAKDFCRAGATHIHLVDLEGARSGETPNLDTVCRIKRECGLFCEIGGGVRSMAVVDRYMEAGLDRVILGTAAVSDPDFLADAVGRYGERIAVGVDIKNGEVAVKGWTESSGVDAFSFCRRMQEMGVRTIISTDISRDGAMQGANHALYERLSRELCVQIVASGGVSSIEDVKRLAAINLYGAIIGKAYYTGAVCLKEAIEVAT